MKLIEHLLQKKVIFVGGKGGVGKTTSSSALAVHFANLKRKTLIISTDPAHSLGDALAVNLSHQSTKINDFLDAIELDSHHIVHQHFKQVEKTLSLYTKPEMMPKMREFLRLSHHAPGAEEAAMLEAICQTLVDNIEQYDHIIFDTAPTGHTLRLLTLPEMMQAWTDGLIAQQKRQKKLREAAQNFDKERNFNPFVEENNRFSEATKALLKRRELFAHARDVLHNAQKCAVVLVLIPEHLPIFETKRALKQLKESKLPVQGLIVNQVLNQDQKDHFWQQRADRQREILQEIALLTKEYSQLSNLFVPLKSGDIRGVRALSEFFSDIY